MSDETQYKESLSSANELFHQAYGATRDGVSQRVPVLVLLANQVALHRGEERHAYDYGCEFFSHAKTAAHIAVALFVLGGAEKQEPTRDPDPLTAAQARWKAVREHCRVALNGLQHASSQGSNADLVQLLEQCLAFGERAPASEEASAARARFAREAGPLILRLTEQATREQIGSLHRAVDTAFGQLTPRELDDLQVVVVGDHQARSRSLGMQYFKRRLRESPGQDERVTYGENISSEQEALTLVGTRELDKIIARAFFGDDKRLQRDVLGDAAELCLDELQLAPEPEPRGP